MMSNNPVFPDGGHSDPSIIDEICHFIQVNLNHSFLAAVEFARLFSTKNKHPVALLSEPYVCFNKLASLPRSARCIAFGENPRAAIVYHTKYTVTAVAQLLSRDVAAGLLSIGDRQIL
jgi:hypothetical protein